MVRSCNIVVRSGWRAHFFKTSAQCAQTCQLTKQTGSLCLKPAILPDFSRPCIQSCEGHDRLMSDEWNRSFWGNDAGRRLKHFAYRHCGCCETYRGGLNFGGLHKSYWDYVGILWLLKKDQLKWLCDIFTMQTCFRTSREHDLWARESQDYSAAL